MASPNTAEQHKNKKLRKSFDALEIVPPPQLGLASKDAFSSLMMPSIPAVESSSTASAESSSGREHLPYDIFISHPGKDTDHTFASKLYNRLVGFGLRVFWDKNDVEPGDFFPNALKEAIVNASVYIAILSPNYAQSPWCLDELTHMLQTGIKFLPIFYHVEPSAVRWMQGVYADAFNQYEKNNRYSRQELESWKLALYKASSYTGHIITNQDDKEVALMNVVNYILKKLGKQRLTVARYLVGLDEAEQEFEKIALQSSLEPVQIVGIWGMRSVGKTTLAKHLYNKKCSNMKGSSFLFDVREASLRGKLQKIQERLLTDLTSRIERFDSINKGKEILGTQLRSLSVLIVLDDVDHKDQLDALLPNRNNLGNGSLIIVTTRDRAVLRACGISIIYEIKRLDHFYAEELFCWHAFGQPSPYEDFKGLAKKFTIACCGLPLSLKVLGSLLHGFGKSYWQSQLAKLSKVVPYDIKSTLEISYYTLDDEEKEMFLDVACFFIGWPSSSAIAIWDESNWSGLFGLQKLVNKCLVELDEDDNIKMIDHLRDLGREIANKQSPYRLCSKQQIINILPGQEAIQIRGMANAFGENCYLHHGKIRLKTNQGERHLAPSSLGLKIFISEGGFINEDCGKFSSELLLFCCDKFPHKNLPSWLPLKILRVLKLVEPEKLEDLWECYEDAPLQLRHLVIYGAYELKKISALSSLRFLETLIINDCQNLYTLPSLTEATYLQMFDLRHCYKLEKIESLESLRSLETLIISDCTELKTLPSLAEATSLQMFDLRRCYKLEEIERSRNSEILSSLKTLIISHCTKLNTLPSLVGATSLKEIKLSSCNKLEKIECLENLGSLERLIINDCPALEILIISHCFALEKIECQKSLRSLKTLIINDCTELSTLPGLVEVTSLKMFDLRCCYKLEKIESLESMRSLETLIINDCTELKTIPSLANATSLKMLDLRRCFKLKNIESLTGLSSLETLIINDCTNLYTLPSLAGATSLKMFDLRCCYKLEKMESLEIPKSLETLIINDCTELKTLPSLPEINSLKMFDLRRCSKLEMISGLESLRSLESLIINECTELETLPSLPEINSLKEVDLRRCYKLKEIKSAERLKSLGTLRISHCPALDIGINFCGSK